MHTFDTDGKATIHYNGDYSGDVKISVRNADYEHTAKNPKYHFPASHTITVDFDTLKGFVLGYYRDKLMAIAQGTDEDVENYLFGKLMEQ